MTQANSSLIAAQRLLAFEAGGAMPRSVEESAAAATRIHHKLYEHLAPVIGETGFQTLFVRAVKLSKPAFPALQPIDVGQPVDAVLNQFWASLKERSPDPPPDIVTGVTANFIGLLSTFIGEALTWKLLHNAWPDALPSEPPSGERP